jgi:hypothetical protein
LPLFLDPSEYPRFYQLLQARSLSIAAPFSMPTSNSTEDFFKRARERGSEIETDIVNDDEVKKELQPGTKKNYCRALALWHQWVLQSASGNNRFSDSSSLHVTDT